MPTNLKKKTVAVCCSLVANENFESSVAFLLWEEPLHISKKL